MTKTKPSAGKEGAKLQPQSTHKTDKSSKEKANTNPEKYFPLHQTIGYDAK
jgi:hypothetical protein